MTRTITREHHVRQGFRQRARRRQWHSESRTAGKGREHACEFDVTMKIFASADMSSAARPRLRSEIGEVRGSLKRISAAEFLAREAAVQGDVGAEPSSLSPSSQAASRGTRGQFLIRQAAVQGSAGAAPSSSLPNGPPYGTNGLLLACAEHQQRADAAPASLRMKTCPITEHPVMTSEHPAKAFHDVPERYNAEPDVLARASYLKTRFAGLIAKSEDELSLRRVARLERRPAGTDEWSIDTEGEMAREALRRETERSAWLARLREMAREALREVERNARLTGLCVETIHPVHLMELGITAVEHVVSPEGRRDRNGVLRVVAASVHRHRSPLEELGLLVKPIDGGELEIEGLQIEAGREC